MNDPRVGRISVVGLCVFVLCACLGPRPQQSSPALVRPTARQACGDGVCTPPENMATCAFDCTPPPARTYPNPLPSNTPQPNPPASSVPGVVYLGVMVHLEGWGDDKSENRFGAHTVQIRDAASLFEKYGARLTFESKEVTEGVLRWGDNVLLEMEQRGHGVGVHADLGGSLSDDCARLAPELRAEREQLESLGVRVRHVSGNNSHCDWIAATIDAGYSFTTGVVAYGVMSMPAANRPPEFRNCKSPAACHDVFPPELEDRLHPWRPASGSDWLTHDPNGKLVILASGQGIACAQEETAGQDTRNGCLFEHADVEAMMDVLDQALELSAPDQVNILYFSWSLGSPLDPLVLEQWLKAVEPYVKAGRVQWKTLPEMYDAYVAWEGG
ncbi:MAG: hypothetical protein NTY23_09550 [Chloroflexi bacterium]|nr:hypothetical protein [Chloroflexota bacterium]